jgi:hypothetical protein
MTTLRTVTLPIAAPDRWLATNDRNHWTTRSAGIKTWRESAALRARQARIDPIRSPYTVRAVIHKPTKRLYDVDGITPTAKACLDGFRDVGLIVDDNWQHMRAFTVEAGDPGPACLVVHITELHPDTPYPTQETA